MFAVQRGAQRLYPGRKAVFEGDRIERRENPPERIQGWDSIHKGQNSLQPSQFAPAPQRDRFPVFHAA